MRSWAPKVPSSTRWLEGWFGRVKPRARLTREMKTKAEALNFMRLMTRGHSLKRCTQPTCTENGPRAPRPPYQRD